MAAAKNHDYHLVEPDPWPLIGAICAGALFSGAVMWFHANRYGVPVMLLGIAGVLITMFNWWSNTIREAHQGDHTPIVQLHLRYGMILFIASEVMFFVGWFWALFDCALFPSRRSTRSAAWPPKGDGGAQPVRLPAAQHPDPAVLGHHRHLGAPFADPRRPPRAQDWACG